MITAPTIDRAAWLAERRKGIGAAEAAAILGISPWATPLEVYLRKLELIPEQESTPLMEWGLRLEPAIAAKYAEETGREITKSQGVMRLAEWPIMLASLDYVAVDRVVEIKRVSEWAAKEFGPAGTAEVPEHYFIQCQQQMAVSGHQQADLAALIGHCDFRIYTIPRSDAVIERLLDAEKEFWDRVERQDPPLPDFQHPTTADILALIEPDAAEVVELGDEELFLVDCYEHLGATAREAEASRKETKAKLIHRMGTAGVAVLPDGRTVRRKTINRNGYTVEPSSYVDFRILKGKTK